MTEEISVNNLIRTIVIKSVKLEDHPVVGPKIGILDREGHWYNSLKNDWKQPKTWDELCALKRGDWVEMHFHVKSYQRKDGEWAATNVIDAFEKKPAPEKPTECIPGNTSETPTKPPTQSSTQEMSPKQTCLKSATDLIVARIGSGDPVIDMVGDTLALAKKLYKTLTESW